MFTVTLTTISLNCLALWNSKSPLLALLSRPTVSWPWSMSFSRFVMKSHFTFGPALLRITKLRKTTFLDHDAFSTICFWPCDLVDRRRLGVFYCFVLLKIEPQENTRHCKLGDKALTASQSRKGWLTAQVLWILYCVTIDKYTRETVLLNITKGGHSITPKNHKRQRRKRWSVTAKREKSQTPKFV